MPLLDKDTILEALFDSLGCDDRAQRGSLSRASDKGVRGRSRPSPAGRSSGLAARTYPNHANRPRLPSHPYAALMMEVRTTRKRERRSLSKTLAVAFADDPVVRWLMPAARHDLQLFRVLAAHFHAAPGCADVAFVDASVEGVALWDPPGHQVPARHQLMGSSRLRLAMGAAEFRRCAVLETAFARARPPGQLWYLAELGASMPGRGIGSALLEHRLTRIDEPAYLHSSNVVNVPLYRRHGFEVIGEIRLPEGGPTLWTMLRA